MDDEADTKNANGTYRSPGRRVGSFRIENQLEETVIYGDLVNSLGEYEDIGTAEEFRDLKQLHEKK